MQRLCTTLFLTLAAFLLTGGCADRPTSAGTTPTPAGVPALTRGDFIPNACLVDAIVCYNALKDSGAEPAILGINYRAGSEVDGHAMTRFFWPPRADKKPWTQCYLFDRQNRSTAVPSVITPENAVSLASWVMPAEVTKAWWLDPAELNAATPAAR